MLKTGIVLRIYRAKKKLLDNFCCALSDKKKEKKTKYVTMVWLCKEECNFSKKTGLLP